jgi:ligand-binding sensor domain-containing protein
MKSVYRYCLLIGWLLMGILHIAFAQTEEIQIRIYGFEEGLSHRNVFKIQQDTNGFLWFATINGLNKYDGYEFMHFGEDEGPNPLFEAFISDMVFDPENQLWVAHPNYLSIMDPASGRLRQIPLNPRSSIRGEEHTPAELATTSDGNAWMITYIEKTAESYLQQFSPEGKLVHSIPLPGNEEVRPMLLANDQLYVGGFENEVWLLNTQGERIDQFNFGFRGTSPSASRVTDITRNASGRIFILLNSGEVYREKKQGGFELHPISYLMDHKSFYNHLLVEDDGDIWMAGEEHLCYYQASNNKLVDFNTEIQEITRYPTTYRQIFQDQSGVVWVASNFGAIKIVRSKRLFTNYLNGGNSYCSSGYCSMRGMAEDEQGNVYFTYYNSIHKLLPDGTVEPLLKNRNFINSPFGLVFHKDHLITGNGLKIHLKTEQIDTLLMGRIMIREFL